MSPLPISRTPSSSAPRCLGRHGWVGSWRHAARKHLGTVRFLLGKHHLETVFFGRHFPFFHGNNLKNMFFGGEVPPIFVFFGAKRTGTYWKIFIDLWRNITRELACLALGKHAPLFWTKHLPFWGENTPDFFRGNTFGFDDSCKCRWNVRTRSIHVLYAYGGYLEDLYMGMSVNFAFVFCYVHPISSTVHKSPSSHSDWFNMKHVGQAMLHQPKMFVVF